MAVAVMAVAVMAVAVMAAVVKLRATAADTLIRA